MEALAIADEPKKPTDFDEIRFRSRRPFGGALKSYKCFCCGSATKLANHHITSRSEGGIDDSRNKVILCSRCRDAVEGEPWLVIMARREEIRQQRWDSRPGR